MHVTRAFTLPMGTATLLDAMAAHRGVSADQVLADAVFTEWNRQYQVTSPYCGTHSFEPASVGELRGYVEIPK